MVMSNQRLYLLNKLKHTGSSEKVWLTYSRPFAYVSYALPACMLVGPMVNYLSQTLGRLS